MVMIFTTWANRKYAPENFELVHAWDEFSVDDNGEGYQQTRDEAIEAMGDDRLRSVVITIEVPYEAIYEALNPPILKLQADVVP